MPKKRKKPFSTENPIRVFVVDDHPLILEGLCSYIMKLRHQGEPFDLAGSALNVGQSIERILEDRGNLPDLLLLDIWLNDSLSLTALDIIDALDRENIYIPVLIYSGECVDGYMLSALLKVGVSGYIMKNDLLGTLTKAMYSVAMRKTYFAPEVRKRINEKTGLLVSPLFPKLLRLTPHELIYLRHFVRGLPFEDIAIEMGISKPTLYNHGNGIKTKLGVEKLTDLNRKAMIGMIAIMLGNDP